MGTRYEYRSNSLLDRSASSLRFDSIMTKKQQKALYEEMLPLIQEYRELAKLGEQYKKEVALHKQKSTKTNEMTRKL